MPSNQAEKPVQSTEWHDSGDADVMPGSAHRPVASEPFQSILHRSLNRRALLKGATASGAALVLTPVSMLHSSPAHAERYTAGRWANRGNPAMRLQFATVPPGNAPDVMVPPNYQVQVLLRWGDPLTTQAPEFDVYKQSAEAQSQQFGFNADLVLWYPLQWWLVRHVAGNDGKLNDAVSRVFGGLYSRMKHWGTPRALVVVNHEYTSAADMFPDYDAATYPTAEQAAIEIEAHGFSVVELQLAADGSGWQFVRDSAFNRRSTGSTPIEISGPLRGHSLMQTSEDPTGSVVLGTFNNCAGGKTPWGTTITCEENFDQYFANFDAVRADDPYLAGLSERIPASAGETERGWETHVKRFDLSQEPNEYNRFGFCVEFDPYNPSAPAKKRTALGRFKHEGAAVTIAADGRAVLYSGDDARFEYIYKFVSDGFYKQSDRVANMSLLDSGTLYVARFDAGAVEGDDMGDGVWIELSPSTAELAAWTMEEILLNTRGAADAVAATPMDRPEDVEISPKTGKIYVCLTNNSRRTEPNEANPRVDNEHGHILEIIEDHGDHTSLTFTWNILVRCGDPAQDHDTRFGDVVDPVAAGVSPISDPDNIVHDDDGNLWIATDGQYFSGDVGFGQNDGIFAVPVEGPDRGLLRQFLSGVPGGEICGPEFSGDNKTFFCAIQHPNDGEAFVKLWPTDETVVSKPSLIAVREKSAKKIGY